MTEPGSPHLSRAILKINDAYPVGVLAGFDAGGKVVVCMKLGTKVEWVSGSEIDRDRVCIWECCQVQDRRLRAQATWQITGFFTVACA